MNSLMLALIMGAVPMTVGTTSPLSTAPLMVQPPPIVWSLEGRIGLNQDGRLAAGLTLTPDIEMPLGVWFQVEEIEFDQVIQNKYTTLRYGAPPYVNSYTTTTQDEDLKWSAGVSWRFR